MLTKNSLVEKFIPDIEIVIKKFYQWRYGLFVNLFKDYCSKVKRDNKPINESRDDLEWGNIIHKHLIGIETKITEQRGLYEKGAIWTDDVLFYVFVNKRRMRPLIMAFQILDSWRLPTDTSNKLTAQWPLFICEKKRSHQ